jgi:hypothetical protein
MFNESQVIGPAAKLQSIVVRMGDPTRRRKINCDGHDVKVTTNLYEALRWLRGSNVKRFFDPLLVRKTKTAQDRYPL